MYKNSAFQKKGTQKKKWILKERYSINRPRPVLTLNIFFKIITLALNKGKIRQFRRKKIDQPISLINLLSFWSRSSYSVNLFTIIFQYILYWIPTRIWDWQQLICLSLIVFNWKIKSIYFNKVRLAIKKSPIS